MRRVVRLLLERLHDHPLDLLIIDRARLPRTRLVVQSVKPARRETHPPAANRGGVTAELLGDLDTRPPLRRRQNNPAAKRERLRRLRSPRPPLQHLPLLTAKHDRRPLRHNRPPSSSLTRTDFANPQPVPANYRLRSLAGGGRDLGVAAELRAHRREHLIGESASPHEAKRSKRAADHQSVLHADGVEESLPIEGSATACSGTLAVRRPTTFAA
jgi:hypothetical protein